MMLIDVFGSVIKHLTLVLLCSCNAANLSTDCCPPPGMFSVIVAVDSTFTVFQVMILSLLEDAQVNSTICPTLTFCDAVASIKVIPVRSTQINFFQSLNLTSVPISRCQKDRQHPSSNSNHQ